MNEFRLPVPSFVRPVKLAREVELTRRFVATGSGFDDQARVARERLLLRQLGSKQDPRPLSRGDLRFLELVAFSDGRWAGAHTVEPPTRLEARRWLLDAHARLAWRTLLRLWALTLGPELAELLRLRIEERLARNPGFAERLPAWLRGSVGELRATLERPVPRLVQSILQHGVALVQVVEATQVDLVSQLSERYLPELISSGPPSWWSPQDMGRMRAWATARQLPILSAVADRQLLDFGGGAKRPSDLQMTDYARSLVRWVTNELGHPDDRPERWAHMSEAARQVMRMVSLAQAIDDILAAFGKGAERARYNFWKAQVDRISDAYFLPSDTAICLMVIGGYLFVEFGVTGNACYMYQRPKAPLRELMRGEQNRSSYSLKRYPTLELGGEQIRYINKLGHTSGWEYKFTRYIQDAEQRR